MNELRRRTGLLYELAWKATNVTIWRVITLSNVTSYTLNGLVPGTVYQWKVRNVCTPTSEVVYAGPANFTTTGSCTPLFSAGCSDADGINSVTFNSIVLSTNNGCSIGGYRSVTNVAATITPGTNYTFTISLLSPTYGEHVGIWIDLDRNGTFAPTERLFQTASTVTGTFSGSLTIPAGITPGLLTMRVLARYNAVANDPCGSYTYGEAEDYKLLIVEPTCAAPTGLTAVNVTKNQAQLNFGASGSYQLHYKPQASADWSTIGIITGSTYTLTGLQPNTDYQWRLQRVCSTTAISDFSSTLSFTTADGVCEPAYTAGCGFGDALVAFRFNSTQLSQGSGCSSSAYRSFTTVSATVVAGQSYPFSGTFSSSTEEEGVVIWIDFNRNNTFETAERVFQTTSLVTGGISGSVAIPSGSTPGTLRMRVMVVYGLANPTNPCGTYEYGETEDYLLTIPGAVCTSMYTVKTGDWTDPTVWSCNRLPTSADAVEIRHAVAIPAAGTGLAQKVNFTTGGGITYGVGARLQLGTL